MATTTVSDESSTCRLCSSRRRAATLVAADAGLADVDRQPQRIPACDRLAADEALVDHGEADLLADLPPRSRAASRRSRRAARAPRVAARRRAASSEAPSSALGLVDSSSVTTRSTTASSSRVATEMEHRRLGQAADDLVGRGDDEIGAGLQGARGQLVGEAKVGAPGLVDDQRDVARVGNLGQPGDVGAGAEVGRGDDQCADRIGRRIERALEHRRRQAVGEAELGIDLRRDEDWLEPGEDGAVDRRGVDVSLHDHRASRSGEARGRPRGFPARRRRRGTSVRFAPHASAASRCAS